MLTYMINETLISLQEDTGHLLSLSVGGEPWFETDGAPLWQLLAVDEVGRSVTLDGSMASNFTTKGLEGGGIILSWHKVQCADAGPFDVQVYISSGETPESTRWRISVDNHAESWTLWQVIFPTFAGIRPDSDDAANSICFPQGWGTLQTGWSKMEELDRFSPRGWDWAMQFFCFTRRESTLALSVEDALQTPKRFRFSKQESDGLRSATMAIVRYPEGMSQAGNSFYPEDDTVLTVSEGDWYDAAQEYAKWARAQSWVAPLSSEREIHAWQLMQVPEKPLETWAEEMETLQERLGVSFGIHLYNWHETPFDMNYPDYFPAREGIAEIVTRLRAHGILMMPYINGRLWDINAPSWQARGAEQASAKQSALRLQPKTLVPYLEEYGSGQKLAPMCPTTELWQETLLDLCRRITGELGCNGIYLDQVAAEGANLCLDPTHGHPLGGGGYWRAGYHAFMKRLREQVGKDVYLTTECNWEACAADFDALLMWHSFGPNLVPLFPAVYSGLARTFACQFNQQVIENNNGLEFADRMAMLFVWGAQIGWGDLTLLLPPAQAPLLDYFVSLAKLRAAHVDTFTGGRLLRPPVVEAEQPIRASVWQTPTGERTLFLVNPTREEVPVRAILENGETISETLPPLSALCCGLK